MKPVKKGTQKADGESAVLAKIAALPQPDRAMGERLHAIIKANAPVLSPKTWYGMPAYAKDGNVKTRYRRSASATRPISTKATCGPPPSRSRS